LRCDGTFRFGQRFESLDNFFHVGQPGHLWSREELEKRIEELDGIYRSWNYDLWFFSAREEERNRFQDYAHTTLDTLRNASLCHIMGLFTASIMLSSMATERLLHCILLLSGTVKMQRLPKGARIVEVRTIIGNEGYAIIPKVGWEPVVYKDNTPCYLKLPSLGEEPLKAADELGYPSRELLDSNESFDSCLFVARRHAMAHSRFERIDLMEQARSFVTQVTPSPYPMFDQSSSLDQYKKASAFISKTFERFGAVYGSSLNRPQ
jgi:hypothetical protein